MTDFKKFFEEQYQFALDHVSFKMLETNVVGEISINIDDEIDTKLDNSQLTVSFERHVYFTPVAVFDLSVGLSFRLSVKPDKSEEAEKIDWTKEILEQPNAPYLSNIVSRASNIIANLTSSYGQQPIVTPPVFIS